MSSEGGDLEGGGCGNCGGKGVCEAGSCAAPIPAGQPNFLASQHLQLLFVVDIGDNSSSALAIRAAVEIALQFTTGPGGASVGIIGYSDKPKVIVPLSNLEGINKTIAGLVCNSALRCSGKANPAALVHALALANATLTAVSNTTEDEDLFQTVIVITSQVQTNSEPPRSSYYTPSGPVISARSMWASGIHVVSVIADDVCKLPPPESGSVPSFHCGGAALIASAKLISPSEKAAKQVAAASAAAAASLVDTRMATAAVAVAPPVLSLYDLRKLSTEAVAVAVATELAHRPKPKCEWEEYPHRRIAFSYRTIHRKVRTFTLYYSV